MFALQLLPTPAKSHYTFNLRDLSKVFQGILMAEAQKLSDLSDVLRLWYHENCRVFQDRLVNDEDRKWFVDLIRDKMASGFEVSMGDVVKDSTMIYGDFMVPSAENKVYNEVAEFNKVNFEVVVTALFKAGPVVSVGQSIRSGLK